MRVGVLTGGGDCPGLNAVIRAVTKSLINHGQCEVLGIADGFEGLMLDPPGVKPLGWDEVSGILHVGGTILGTSNSANPLRDAATLEHVGRNVRALGLDVVVAIGGDGTMSLAHGLAEQVGLTCVGVPKTIDNDIANCERSFGFDTAVATATEALRRIESTANSHHRVMIVETMGRHAGWLALEAGIAGAADVILLPEIDYDLQAIVDFCRGREQRQRYTIICIGEGAKESGASLTVRERIEQSPDPVRLGGVGHVLRERLQSYLRSEVRTTVLGHVQRGGDPTPFDRVLATQYGHHAAQLVLGALRPHGHAAGWRDRQRGNLSRGQHPAHRAPGPRPAHHGARHRHLPGRAMQAGCAAGRSRQPLSPPCGSRDVSPAGRTSRASASSNPMEAARRSLSISSPSPIAAAGPRAESASATCPAATPRENGARRMWPSLTNQGPAARSLRGEAVPACLRGLCRLCEARWRWAWPLPSSACCWLLPGAAACPGHWSACMRRQAL